MTPERGGKGLDSLGKNRREEGMIRRRIKDRGEGVSVACGNAWDSRFISPGQSVERHRCARACSNNKS